VAFSWHNIKAAIKKVAEEGLMVSINGDVWGENAISLFAVMGHCVDEDFQLQNMLSFCEPFESVRYTGKIISAFMD
jgi:MoaA/NifB/PqqE/SkfB family radical SAM enzyme